MFNSGYIAAPKGSKAEEGTGIISTNPPLGVWTPISLGVGLANKTVQINCISTFGTRACGVRPTSSITGITIPCSFSNSTTFLVTLDSNGEFEGWRNNNGISFYHIATLG
jgi:hypothetical protein